MTTPPRSHPTRRALLSAGVGAPLLASAGIVFGQSWRERPIRFVVPFAAGSGTDIVARLVGARLSEALGQPVVVENKVGASGAIAASAVARSAPDGSTVFIATQTTHASNAGMFKRLPYDPIRDFDPVTLLGTIPLIVVVNPSIPANDLRELVSWARANPGRLSCGFGTGAAQVTGELFKTLSKADILLVPYRSNPQALAAVVGNEVGMMITDPGSSLALIGAGKVRALAVTTARRSALVPTLPTTAEAGLGGYELSAWYAALVPAGTPAPVRDRLQFELSKIIAMPDVRHTLGAAGIEAASSSPEELATFIADEARKWARLIRDAGITPE